MPLEPTANPEQRSNRRVASRIIGWSLAFGLILGGMTACAEGTSRDAEIGKQKDAERTSVVTGVQATSSARLLAGSPEATPPAAVRDSPPGS